VAERQITHSRLKTREAIMGYFRRPRAFTPLDLEVLDRVFEAAWERVKARDLFRDTNKDEARKQALRRLLFVLAQPGKVDFDVVYDRLMTNIPEPWAAPPVKRRSSPPEVGA
jgi:hypothetical protein